MKRKRDSGPGRDEGTCYSNGRYERNRLQMYRRTFSPRIVRLQVERRRDPEDREEVGVEVVEDHVGRGALAHARQLGQERQVAEDKLREARDRRRALRVALRALEVAEARGPASGRAAASGNRRGNRGIAAEWAWIATGRNCGEERRGRERELRRTGRPRRRSRRTRCS